MNTGRPNRGAHFASSSHELLTMPTSSRARYSGVDARAWVTCVTCSWPVTASLNTDKGRRGLGQCLRPQSARNRGVLRSIPTWRSPPNRRARGPAARRTPRRPGSTRCRGGPSSHGRSQRRIGGSRVVASNSPAHAGSGSLVLRRDGTPRRPRAGSAVKSRDDLGQVVQRQAHCRHRRKRRGAFRRLGAQRPSQPSIQASVSRMRRMG